MKKYLVFRRTLQPMKPMPKNSQSRGNFAFAKLLVAGAVLLSLPLTGVQSLRAATYSWDPSITGGTSPGGSGTWNTSLTNWWDGTFDSAWGNTTADVGVFGGSAGAVSVSTALNAGTLQFLTTGYTFTGSAITLGAGGIDASALSSGTTSIANAIALGAGQSWNIGTGASLLASGIISGTNSLAKTGAGTLTLSAINTFSGGLTLSQGTLSIAANTALGGTGGTTGAVTLNGGTLKTTNTAALTNTHAITIGASGGAFNITGTGASQAGRVITGANTLLGSGTLTINGNGAVDAAGGSGVLVVTGSNASFTGNILLQNGGLLANEGGSYGSAATITLSNNSELSTTNTLANAITVNGGTNSVLSFTNGAAGVYAGPITLNGNLTFSMRNWYNQTVQSGAITSTMTGGGAITINAGSSTGGTLTFKGFDAKASTSDITVNSSNLAIDSSTGTAAASVTRGKSLTLNASGLTVTGVSTQNTSDVFTNALNIGTGVSTITLTPNAATSTQVSFGSFGTRATGSVLNIAGTFGSTSGTNMANLFFGGGFTGSNFIGGGGANGTATASVIPWMRNGPNGLLTYDGTKGLQNLTGQITTLATSGSNQNNYAISAGATLTGNLEINSLQTNASATLDMAGNTLRVDSGVLTSQVNYTIGAASNSGTLAFGAVGSSVEGVISVASARTLTINSVIAGSGGLTEIGYGASSGVTSHFILNGANTFTGTSNFLFSSFSDVRLTNSLALQNSTVNMSGATLLFGNGGTTGQTAYTFGGLVGTLNLTLANNNTTVQGVALTVGGDGDSTTYSGVLSDSGTGGSLIKTGTGVLTLSGANTFNGGVSINGGKLNVARAEIAGTSGPLGKTGTISFGGGALQYSAANTFDYSSRFSTAASQAYSVDTNGQNVTWGTALTSSGGSLAKAGSGTLTLSAASTYTGSTAINAGTLLLSGAGSISNSSVINVASGARFDVSGVTGGNYTIASGQTLNGKGTVVGDTTIAGNLAPGNSPGLLTFTAALTLSGTATMEINNAATPVRGTDYDGADVGGLLTYGGALNLTMTSLITAGTYDLFDFGSVTGNFSSVAFAGGIYAGTFTYNSGNDTWNATDTNGSGQSFSYSLATGDLNVVPEPSTYALLGMGLVIVLTSRRRIAGCRE